MAPKEGIISCLEKGSYFGEIALLTKMKRTATVRANEYCTFATLNRNDFQVCQQEFPSIFLNFKKSMRHYEDT